MTDYRKGDALAITQPDGSRHTFRVMAVAADPVDPDALSFTLRRIDGPPHRQTPPLTPEALAAASGSVIGVVPLAQKLAEYRLTAANAGDGALGLLLGHDPCVWHQAVSSRLEVRLPHVIALALEHHLAGCRVPR
jgi:hypothetical protein